MIINELMDFFLSEIIAVSAIVISLISLYVGIKSVENERTHNIQSVRPIGDIRYGASASQFFIDVVNNGIGPMLIKNIKTNGEENKSPGEFILFKFKNLSCKKFDFRVDLKDTALKEGDSIRLLYILFDSSDDEHIQEKEKIRSLLADMNFELEYTDIYNIGQPILSRKLSIFKNEISNKIRIERITDEEVIDGN